MNCVYILHSIKLNRFYIGYTSDFDGSIRKPVEQQKFYRKACKGFFSAVFAGSLLSSQSCSLHPLRKPFAKHCG